MLRQRAASLTSRCLHSRFLTATELRPGLHPIHFAATQEAGQFGSLTRWLVSSWQSQIAHFSSSWPVTATEVPQAPEEVKAAARETADDTEQAASEAGPTGQFADEPAPEDPYAGLTQDEIYEALKEKDAEVAAATAQAEELADAVKRALADMENLRQRSARQAENSKKFAIQGFLKSMLDVGDNLERAYGSVPAEALRGEDESGQQLSAEKAVNLLKGLLNGVKLTEKIFEQGLRENGVVKYVPKGEKFDPNLHDALFEVPDPEQEPGTIRAVTKTGYTLHGRVVRPAQVGVVRAAV